MIEAMLKTKSWKTATRDERRLPVCNITYNSLYKKNLFHMLMSIV